MELVVIIALVLVVAVIIIAANRPSKLDINQDGEVNAKDIQAAVETLAKAADVDGDGRISVKDAKAAIRKTKETVAAKVQTNKPRGRRPSQKKG